MHGITKDIGERCITPDQKLEARFLMRHIIKKKWCEKHKISYSTLMRLLDVRDDYGTKGMIMEPGSNILRLMRKEGFLR